MKKIIAFLVFLQLLLFSVFTFNLFNEYKTFELLYSNSSSILIKMPDGKYSKNGLIDYLNKISKEKDISISRYVFQNENNLSVYTTDPTLNGKVSLREGKYPKLATKQFISMIDTHSKNQIGIIKQANPNFTITIRNLTVSDNFGEEGIYYLGTSDRSKVEQIISGINQNVAQAEIIDNANQFSFSNNTTLLLSVIIIAVCILIAFSYYLVNVLRVISILKIHGYNLSKIIFYILKDISKPLLISIISSYLVCVLYYCLNYRTDYLGELSFLYLLYSSIVFLFYLLFLVICLYFTVNKISITNSIKGKRNFTLLTFANYLLKLIFLSFLLFSIHQLIHNMNELESKMTNLSAWQKTQNLYATKVAYTGQGNLKNEYRTNKKLKGYYIDLEDKHNGFLMDASNYTYVGSEPVYKLNTNNGNTSISPNGKRVTINKNYLKYNPIEASKGTIKEQIKNDDTILNILVPNNLKPFEKEIVKQYKEYFYFQKVSVANIYNKELKKNLNKTKIDELNINIIYVKDHQKYFTFNPEYGEETGYFINDPIAIVDVGNFDNSYYLSYLSSYFYFYSDSGDPYNTLLPLIEKNNVQSSIQRVVSIYDSHGQEIQDLKMEKKMNQVIILVLILSNLIVTFNIIASYYRKNRMKLYIKKLFGFSSIRSNWRIISILFLINLIPTIILSLLFNEPIFLAFMFIVIVLECILMIFVEKILFKKSLNSIIKGER